MFDVRLPPAVGQRLAHLRRVSRDREGQQSAPSRSLEGATLCCTTDHVCGFGRCRIKLLGKHYEPIDELLELPIVRILRALSHASLTSAELFELLGIASVADGSERNSYAVILSRLVKRGALTAAGEHGARVYAITDTGRALLAQGFAARDADSEPPAPRKRRTAQTAKPGAKPSGRPTWTRAALDAKRVEYHRRKDNRLCVACGAGLQPDDGVRCVECKAINRKATDKWSQKRIKSRSAEAIRARYWADPERHRAARRDRYRDHKLRELCVLCSEHALADSNYCAGHRVSEAARAARDQAKRRARKAAAGKCVHCRDPVEPGRTMCAAHLARHRDASRRWAERNQRRAA